MLIEQNGNTYRIFLRYPERWRGPRVATAWVSLESDPPGPQGREPDCYSGDGTFRLRSGGKLEFLVPLADIIARRTVLKSAA